MKIPIGIRKAQADEKARVNIAGCVSGVRRRLRAEADSAARRSTAPNDEWAQCADELHALHAHLADVLPNLRRALNGEEIVMPTEKMAPAAFDPWVPNEEPHDPDTCPLTICGPCTRAVLDRWHEKVGGVEHCEYCQAPVDDEGIYPPRPDWPGERENAARHEPDYVVIHDPNRPSLHGKWFDRADWAAFTTRSEPPPGAEEIAYTATGMIEVRDDGAVAEIFMRATP